jgi:hypothetical protein
MNKVATLTLVLLAASALAASAATVDGTLDPAYGPALSTQTTQTNFGDASAGTVDNANGSELDQAYGYVSGTTLYLFLSGNLESNFNKLEIFLDTQSGGQNKLRGDNANVDFNGLNRMGDDGTGNGLRFDNLFAPDYWIGITGGGGPPYALYANYGQLLTGGGGIGDYLGTTGAASNGVLSGGNDHGIQVTINNSNTAGVSGGCGAASGAGPTTGVELAIPLAAIGGASSCINVCAFINGSNHDFVSNQVLGPLPAGTCNLGEPRNVDFNQFAGPQYFGIQGGCSTPTKGSTWGGLKAMYR